MSSAKSISEDWLALSNDAANTSHANLYFIGAGERRITFYSQQVRALHLAYGLMEAGKVGPKDQIAVVGAGAAGITAAVACALLGKDVTLYDPAEKVLALQSASPRLLHPHIYEWPKLGSLAAGAGLPILDWSSNVGSVVCANLEKEFQKATISLSKLRFNANHELKSIERLGTDWRLGFQSNGNDFHREYKHVVLAMGFGDEKVCGSATPTNYWKQSGDLTNAWETKSGTSYLVSGNGDGGLTDLLGLLICDFEHLQFTKEFLAMFGHDRLRAATTAVFRGKTPGQDVEPELALHLLPVLDERGVFDRLKGRLRSDRKVTWNSAGPAFEFSKAAQLNQCMAFAVLHAATRESIPVSRVTSKVDDVKVVAGSMEVTRTQSDGAAATSTYNKVILRHGPDLDNRYAPVQPFYGAYRAYKEKLIAAKPTLSDPPTLSPAVYRHFKLLAAQHFYDDASRPAALAQIERTDDTLVLGVDEATGVVVGQGAVTLQHIAAQCERLPSPITVRLELRPTDMANPDDLVRLARASNGRIELKTIDVVHQEWASYLSTISKTPKDLPHFHPELIDPTSLRWSVDASLLRILDSRMSSCFSKGKCPNIGGIEPEILKEVSAAWPQWRTTLEANEELREGFLRWLANINQVAGAAWSGDHAQLDDLAGALFMIIATHYAEALQPTLHSNGNLRFATEAIAIGSGCKHVEDKPIAAWKEPHQWGVDALIISTSSEIGMQTAEAGTVINAGVVGSDMMSARHVRPAIIQNNSYWRGKLTGPIDQWKTAVVLEFGEFRKRQDVALDLVRK